MSARAIEWWTASFGVALIDTTVVAGLLVLIVLVLGRRHAAVRGALCWLALLKFAIPPQLCFPVLPAPENLAQPFVAFGADASPAGWVVLAHVCGAIAVAGWLVVQHRGVRRIVAEAEAVDGGALVASIVRFGEGALRRLPRLRLSDDEPRPFVCGLLRPTIVLPRSATSTFPQDRLDLILRHEVAHVRHRDLWQNALIVILAPIWWFHPLFWLAACMAWRAQEDRCDDVVLVESGGRAVAYGETLLEAARLVRPRPFGGWQPALGGTGLGRRIRRLLDDSAEPAPRLSRPALVTLVLAGLLVLPGMSQAPPSGPATPPRATIEPNAKTSIFVHGAEHAERHLRRHASRR